MRTFAYFSQCRPWGKLRDVTFLGEAFREETDMSGINSNGISENDILAFAAHLAEGERAAATIEKYGGVIRDLANYLGGRELTRQFDTLSIQKSL